METLETIFLILFAIPILAMIWAMTFYLIYTGYELYKADKWIEKTNKELDLIIKRSENELSRTDQ